MITPATRLRDVAALQDSGGEHERPSVTVALREVPGRPYRRRSWRSSIAARRWALLLRQDTNSAGQNLEWVLGLVDRATEHVQVDMWSLLAGANAIVEEAAQPG